MVNLIAECSGWPGGNRMLKLWVQSFVKAAAVLPSASAGLYVLIEAAKHTYIDTDRPILFARVQSWAGFLFEVLTDHWLAYVLLATVAAFIWIFIVAKLRMESKLAFDAKIHKML